MVGDRNGTVIESYNKQARQGGLALLDQGIVSGSTFVVSMVLARWLDLPSYGAFSLAFAIFLLVSGLHNALILEPMSVLGPSKYDGQLSSYLLAQLRLNLWLTIPIGAVLIAAGVAAVRPGQPLRGALIGAGVAAPLILLFWAARRFTYVLHRPALAVLGSSAYLTVTAAALLAARSAGLLSAFGGFLAMGLGGAMASLCLLKLCRIPAAAGATGTTEGLGIFKDHWGYGRWILAATAVSSLATQFPTFYASGLLGIEAAGIIRAMATVSAPMGQAITALATLALPMLSREFGRGNLAAVRKRGALFTLFLVGVAAVYEVALLLLNGPLEGLLFDGKFAPHAWLMPVFGLVPVFTAAGTGYSLILRAAQKPAHYLIASLVVAPVGLGSTLFLTRIWGLAGAAWSAVLTTAASAGVTYLLCRLWLSPASTKATGQSRPGLAWEHSE